MAISGFRSQNRLPQNLTLKAPSNSKEEEVKKTNEEPAKIEIVKPKEGDSKKTYKQVNYESVNTLLVGKGIKINKPNEPKLVQNSRFRFDSWEQFEGTIGNGNIYRNGDIITVKTKDGTWKTYTYHTTWIENTNYHMGLFIGEDGDSITDYITDFT